jgi:uncharacterized protein (TIGR04255 family)
VADYPTLQNAPIIEAIFDVQVVFPKGVDLAALAQLHEKFLTNYPRTEEEQIVHIGFEHQAGAAPKALVPDHGVRGYRFISEDGKQIVQCRRDGFTFNRLRPYPSWNDVVKFAAPAWDVYRTAFPEIEITRVALRYINQVIVPASDGKVKIEDYFEAHLPGPKIAELDCSGFFSQGVFRDVVTRLNAYWTFAHQPTSEPTNLGFVLDIDVYASGADAQEGDVLKLWDRMRDLKNRLFFGSFTEKGLDLFR